MKHLLPHLSDQQKQQRSKMELQALNTTCNRNSSDNDFQSSNLHLQVRPEISNPYHIGEHRDAHEAQSFIEDVDDRSNTCSTPSVSAASSPGRGPIIGFFYSAPASPMRFAITSLASAQYSSSPSYETGGNNSMPLGSEFEFSARFGSNGLSGSLSMSSADELFLNGQIRPMKLSTHLERPQVFTPLLDHEVEDDGEGNVASQVRGRDLRLHNKPLRRRTRSMSPMRNTPLEWVENEDNLHGGFHSAEGTTNMDSSSEMEENGRDKVDLSGSQISPSVSSSHSRSSSAGRSTKRWVFLKDFLYRSKSEGRSNTKFWSTISFSPTKEKKPSNQNTASYVSKDKRSNQKFNGSSNTHKSKASTQSSPKKSSGGKPTNGVGKRRGPPSPHELHYKTYRAQAEELRKKTYLPYRQGLLGCLGFSSKGYGAISGFARALNPVSSRVN